MDLLTTAAHSGAVLCNSEERATGGKTMAVIKPTCISFMLTSQLDDAFKVTRLLSKAYAVP